jgi:DNA repair exonuclease SbcCD ATPase subunit
MAPAYETEKGFGTGLRSVLERKQNGDAEVAAVPDAIVVAARGVPVDVIVQGTVPELEVVRGELEAALEREQVLREETHAACRAVAEREAELETWTGELREREQVLQRRADELEAEQHALVERHTEIVAEYARVQELSSHSQSRVEELETAERDRAEAAAEIAKQVAAMAERERELKRERAAFDARQQEAEARVTARELAVRERDVNVGQRERAVRDAETDLAGARARLDSRATSLQGTEERIAQEARDLRERQTAIEAALDDRMRVTAEGESALQAWEQRLRIEAERLQDERSEHGVTSQDAFALMSELEAREATLSKLEAELLEAQAHLQAAAEDPQRGRDLDEREARLVAQ